MKNGAAIILGIAVFAAVVAAWITYLPKAFSRNAGGDPIFAEAIEAGGKIYGGFVGVQASIDKGTQAIDAAILGEAAKAAAVDGLKAKIEAKNKIKAALEETAGADPAPSNANSHER